MRNDGPHTHLIKCWQAAIKAVHPNTVLAANISANNKGLKLPHSKRIPWQQMGRLRLLAIGKAAHAMATVAEVQLANHLHSGLCITKHGHGGPLKTCKVLEAGHPYPDTDSVKAAQAVMAFIQNNQHNDIWLILLSGGASALVADLPSGISLKTLQQITQSLMHQGATIEQLNEVRKLLSTLKGGQLAKHLYPAKLFGMYISDVSGNKASTVASGMLSPCHLHPAMLIPLLQQYRVYQQLPAAQQQILQENTAKPLNQLPTTQHPFTTHVFLKRLASNSNARKAAAATAQRLGYAVTNKSIKSQTTVSQVAGYLLQQIAMNHSTKKCIILGGEPTLVIHGTGKGGRCQHLALLIIQHLKKQSTLQYPIGLLCAGTDGTDGPTNAAGVCLAISKQWLNNIPAAAINQAMNNFDAYTFFHTYGGHLISGPTGTNVMDLVILLLPQRRQTNFNKGTGA
ncbi:MAG TPA: DUF4147 domain-containing protein [Phnomibacter sp.]|nr:DUF4147 domain-containing protein [Phnomibacter sp.]